MPEDNEVKVLFVVNPISGGKTKSDWEAAITSRFRPLNFAVELYVLDGTNDAESLKHWISMFQPKVVVAVGGDGTVSLVARQLVNTGIALGILPAGSANGMARELGIPENAEVALDVIARGNVRNADVIRINGEHICLHLSDIGLNAMLVKHFEEGNIRGKIGYATKVLKTLWIKRPMVVKIRMNDREESHYALMVVIANATKYGTGAVINPEGSLYDGKFEVVIMKKLAVSELWKMWFRPQPFDPRKINVFPATWLSIETMRKVHFQVDGEYLGKVKNVQAEMLAGALNIIVP